MDKILDRANLGWAAVVAFLSAVFGEFWYLFLAFAILNVLDYMTGIIKARITKKEASVKGLNGILKKVGYWIVIAIAFFVGEAFNTLGKRIGFDLGFTMFVGWFTLCTFIINEIRSVLENLVESGVDVPAWLSKGLEIAGKKIDDIASGKGDDDDSN